MVTSDVGLPLDGVGGAKDVGAVEDEESFSPTKLEMASSKAWLPAIPLTIETSPGVYALIIGAVRRNVGMFELILSTRMDTFCPATTPYASLTIVVPDSVTEVRFVYL